MLDYSPDGTQSRCVQLELMTEIMGELLRKLRKYVLVEKLLDFLVVEEPHHDFSPLSVIESGKVTLAEG